MEETYLEKLNNWYKAEKEAGRILDIKFFPMVGEFSGNTPEQDEYIRANKDEVLEKQAELIYKVMITREIESHIIPRDEIL